MPCLMSRVTLPSLLSPLRHLALVTLSLIAVSTLTQYSSHLLSHSVSPGTHSILYSSEHQSIKNLRPFRRVWKEKAENLPGPASVGSRQPSACQIPFDAELMAWTSQCRLQPSARLSLSLRAQHSDGGLLRHSDWMSPQPQLHIISRSNQQFKCHF